ncbi:MAG: cryptochrome/photolyase family protein [Verrucomicrobiota bacterium]
MKQKHIQTLRIILGDQLNRDSAIFDNFAPESDLFWMAEVPEETEHVWCHQLRIAFFFSAMRHFKAELDKDDFPSIYHKFPDRSEEPKHSSFSDRLAIDIDEFKPAKLQCVRPGDWRVMEQITSIAQRKQIPVEWLPDRHFLSPVKSFETWATNRKSLVLETFYRHIRKQSGILMESESTPEGGQWNYDADNRESFKKNSPPDGIEPPPIVPPDDITTEVLSLVRKRFSKHPGSLDNFDLPVTRSGALNWLDHFIEHRLPLFGKFQDAMWSETHFLYHSRLSCLLNTKLLSPREVIDAALVAYRSNHAPLNSVEGFVRQIIGWREFVRGIYWTKMPEYINLNHLDAQQDIPEFLWTGDTGMACVKDAMSNVIQHGYAHHIQRLMVLGLFAQLLGVNPRKFHEWHMAMYLDAIDWVSLPNTVGMSQFGDGGIVGTKPYCATGNYIDRMSNHCKECRFNPKVAHGDKACPFTSLYWHFLARNEKTLNTNHRMGFQLNNLRRKGADLKPILAHAEKIQSRLATTGIS